MRLGLDEEQAMRTMRHFSWTASTLLAWSLPTHPAAQAPTLDQPIVVGRTVWVITDDGQVKRGRVLGELPASQRLLDS